MVIYVLFAARFPLLVKVLSEFHIPVVVGFDIVNAKLLELESKTCPIGKLLGNVLTSDQLPSCSGRYT